MPRLNVQADIRKRLADYLAPIAVCVNVPEDRPQTLVVISREGGRKLDALRDLVGLGVFAWADSEASAYKLMERVSDYILNLKFADGYALVHEETIKSSYDIQAKSPRWYASYTITTYKPKGI